MIKDFKMYENMQQNDYIIGLPSGQIIDIKPQDINKLKQRGLIRYNGNLLSYVFRDDDYIVVMNLVKNKTLDDLKNDIRNYNKQFRISTDIISEFLDNQMGVRDYTIDDDGKVVVSGNIYINNEDYKRFPFDFKRVSGDFVFKYCEIETLEGCPEEVGGDFVVCGNGLFDLSHGPIYVGGNYNCSDNFLNYIVGAPEIIKHDFDCSNNFIVDLKGGPKKVYGTFNCSNNSLLSIKNAPDCDKIISGKSVNMTSQMKRGEIIIDLL